MSTALISDLHLSDSSPHLTAKFEQFMRDIAPNLDALYILGDLFEVYIGEDDPSPCQQLVFNHLKTLRAQGTQVYLMPGNRDFLYSKKGLARYGITLLADPHLLESPQRLLLTHGDRLNLNDKAYLRYRKVAQNAVIKRLFLYLPLRFRQTIAKQLRNKSKHGVTQYQDAQLAEVDRWREAHNCRNLLHGHTHLPLIQLTDFNNDFPPKQRIVLSDWGPNGHYGLLAGNGPIQLKQLSQPSP